MADAEWEQKVRAVLEGKAGRPYPTEFAFADTQFCTICGSLFLYGTLEQHTDYHAAVLSMLNELDRLRAIVDQMIQSN